jgi:nucleoside-diphosphate-sugar epimerase
VKAVVTGAAGFIGGHVVARLAGEGHQVVGIDRLPAPAGAAGAHLRLDLADPPNAEPLADALREADAVFHLAGRGGVRDTGPDVAAHRRRDNGLAAAAVLAATPLDTPIVVTSSSSVYGGARVVGGPEGRVVPSHECDPLMPRGGYARSKVFVERLCARRRARGGLVTVVRPFTVTGPGQRPDMAVSRWLQAAAAGLPLQVLGSPDRRRDVTDVRQVAVALVDLVAHPNLDVVNLGTGVPVTLRDLLRAVGCAVGRELPVEVAPAAREEPAATCAHTGRLHDVLGWVPFTDLDELVAAQHAAATEPVDLHSSGVSANMAWHSTAPSASTRR